MKRLRTHWSIILLGSLIVSGLAVIVILTSNRHYPQAESEHAGPENPQVLTTTPDRAPAGPLASWMERIASATVADYAHLLDEALALTDSALRAEVVRTLVDTWFRADLQGFSRFLARLEVAGADPQIEELVQALRAILPSLDPALAADEDVRALVQRLITHVARQDPDAAWQLATTWLPEHPREAAMIAIAREFARRSPTAALAMVDTLVSPLRRMQAMSAVGNIWAKSNPQAALAWARTLAQSTERAMALNAILLSASQQDLPMAAATLLDSEQDMNRQYQDQRAADLAAKGLSEADLANDPATYEELMASGAISPPTNPDVELMVDAARAIAERLALNNPEAATAFAGSLQTPFLAHQTLTGVISGWASTDPVGALNHLVQHHPDQGALRSTLFEQWARSDPQAAIAAASQLRTEADRSGARDAALGAWAIHDSQAANRFLDTLPPGERSDPAVGAIVQALAPIAPEEAWNRAQTIGNSNERYRALRAAFTILVADQPEKAQSLLSTATLDQNHAERLAEMLHAVAPAPR